MMYPSRPFISVIIPTYERTAQLSLCLAALASQDYSRERFEVLVVDDGSVESSEKTVESFCDQLNVRFLKQRHSGPAAARNYGAAHAKGELLAFTDDDCMPAHGWLCSLASASRACSDCVLGGPTVNALTDNVYSAASQLIIDYLYGQWNPECEAATFFTSNNLALPARTFQVVGGFDQGWTMAAGEDRELCDRLISHGYRLTNASDAVVRHAHSLTFRTFWRQQFNYGRGASRLHRLRARRAAGRVRVEPMRFYLGLLGFPFAREGNQRKLRLVLLLAMSQVAILAGFLWERAMGQRERTQTMADDGVSAP